MLPSVFLCEDLCTWTLLTLFPFEKKVREVPGKHRGGLTWEKGRREESRVRPRFPAVPASLWCGSTLAGTQGGLCFQRKESNIFQRASQIPTWLFNVRLYCACLENVYGQSGVLGRWWGKKQILCKNQNGIYCHKDGGNQSDSNIGGISMPPHL